MASRAGEGSAGRRILRLWRRLAPVPGGRWLFHRILFRLVPYSGSTGARVTTLEPGRADVRLPDRRAVRNHLRSIHALALANVGELASGLAMLTALPTGVRGIVTGLEIDFHAKARGTVTASARPAVPVVDGSTGSVEHRVRAEIRNEEGEVVATTHVRWRLSPVATGETSAREAP